jgi:hypothetical protein
LFFISPLSPACAGLFLWLGGFRDFNARARPQYFFAGRFSTAEMLNRAGRRLARKLLARASLAASATDESSGDAGSTRTLDSILARH